MRQIHQSFKISEQSLLLNMIKVEGHTNLFRDEESGAIMNLDTAGYHEYVKKRSMKQKQRDEIDSIKSELDEIKMMLKQILKNRD
jgi:hypothetical protein